MHFHSRALPKYHQVFFSVEKQYCAKWTSGLTQQALVTVLCCMAALRPEERFSASFTAFFKMRN